MLQSVWQADDNVVQLVLEGDVIPATTRQPLDPVVCSVLVLDNAQLVPDEENVGEHVDVVIEHGIGELVADLTLVESSTERVTSRNLLQVLALLDFLLDLGVVVTEKVGVVALTKDALQHLLEVVGINPFAVGQFLALLVEVQLCQYSLSFVTQGYAIATGVGHYLHEAFALGDAVSSDGGEASLCHGSLVLRLLHLVVTCWDDAEAVGRELDELLLNSGVDVEAVAEHAFSGDGGHVDDGLLCLRGEGDVVSLYSHGELFLRGSIVITQGFPCYCAQVVNRC